MRLSLFATCALTVVCISIPYAAQAAPPTPDPMDESTWKELSPLEKDEMRKERARILIRQRDEQQKINQKKNATVSDLKEETEDVIKEMAAVRETGLETRYDTLHGRLKRSELTWWTVFGLSTALNFGLSIALAVAPDKVDPGATSAFILLFGTTSTVTLIGGSVATARRKSLEDSKILLGRNGGFFSAEWTPIAPLQLQF